MHRHHRAVGIAATLLLLQASLAMAQTSHDVTFLSQQNIHGVYASCWGWTSPGGSEFAILGCGTGTAIVDVTVPTAPTEKAYIPAVSSSWREMKTYSHYAYIVTEGTNGGMQIVDLATNPPSLVGTYLTTFTSAHSILIVGNYAYVNGAKMGAAQVGIRFLDLTNPTNPVDVGGWSTYYTHDCMVRGNLLYSAGINNSTLSIVDITNKAAPVLLKTFTWPGNKAHNCDLTVDGKYLLTTDETPGGHLHVFDVSDSFNPVLVAEWTANVNDIIHNVHILGNLAYCAYYTAGMRVVDISNPTYPVEVGYYDTWPGASGGYNGNWEVYPFAAAGNLYLSDISTGLYVVRYTPTSGSTSGTVRESGGGPVLSGANVQLLAGPSATSNTTGFYKLFHTPGTHTLVTSLFGYEVDSAAVTINVGSNTVHDVDLVRLPGTALSGTVRNASTTAPIADASLVLGGTPLLQSTSGAGTYAFATVPYGVYTLTASRFGYVSQQHTVSVTVHEPQVGIVTDFDLAPATLSADFEPGPAGWTRVAPPIQATSGLWIWADPVGSGGGSVQPEDDHSVNPGHFCWVTGNAATPDGGVGDADIDNGGTILQSPTFDLSALTNPMLSYWRWYSNDAGSNPGADTLRVELSNNGGATWKVVEKQLQTQARWVQVTVAVKSLLTTSANMRFRVTAEDLGGGSVVEAAFDDFMIYDAPPTATPLPGAHYALTGAVPNPFNPATQVQFELGNAGPTVLGVYDARGRLVRTLWSGPLSAGPHRIAWDGRDGHGRRVASGAYVAKLESGTFTASRRVLLVK